MRPSACEWRWSTAVTTQVVGLALVSGAAGAAPRSSLTTFAWEAPDACPSQAAVVRDIERFLGQPLDSERDHRIDARVDVKRESEQFRAAIAVRTERGTFERHLEHDDCAKLAEATALVIALAIDPNLIVREEASPSDAGGAGSEPSIIPAPAGSPAPRSTATTPPSASPTVEAPRGPAAIETRDRSQNRPRSPARQERSPWRASLGLEVLGSEGPAPGFRPALGGSVGLKPTRRLRFELLARGYAPGKQGVPGHEPAEVRVGLVAGGLHLCGIPLLMDRVELDTCLGGQMGSLHGRGIHLENPEPGRGRWTALIARAALATPVSRWLGLTLGIEAGPTLERSPYVVTTPTGELTVFRPAPFTVTGLLGARVEVPIGTRK